MRYKTHTVYSQTPAWKCRIQTTCGYFALKELDGTVVSNSISYKKLRLLEAATNYITERK